MKRKSFKELGTPTAQAAELASEIKALSPAELLALAQQERTALEAAGEIDELGDVQPEEAPTIDNSFAGSWLEICWRYWRPPTEEEVAAGEKRKKISVKIWCAGEATHIANGSTATVNPDRQRQVQEARRRRRRAHPVAGGSGPERAGVNSHSRGTS